MNTSTSPLEILGPEHGDWQGWPAGAKTIFEAVSARQTELWNLEGSPTPAASTLMGTLDEVMNAASKTELAQTLEQADPQILTRLNAALREHQLRVGMLSSKYLDTAI